MSEVIERRLSFNGGEVSEWIDPRIDLDKHARSCRTAENMVPSIYGGIRSRSGTVRVIDQPNNASIGRAVAFEFSAETNLMMVFSDEEFTVVTTGATPGIPQMANDVVDSIWVTATDYTKGTWIQYVGVPAGIYYCLVSHTSGVFTTDLAANRWVLSSDFRRATPYQPSELAELQFEQQNDVLYVTHPNHQQRIISHLADNHWTIELFEQEWPATRDENITAITLTASATTGSVTITASTTAETFFITHIGSRWVISHNRDDPWVKLVFGSAIIGDTSSTLMVLGEWSLTTVAGSGTGDWSAVIGIQRSTNGTSGWETIRSAGVGRADRSDIITGTELEPCFLRIIFLDETGTAPANSNSILEAVDANHYGLFEITGYTDAQNVTATVLFPIFDTSATTKWREGAWSDYRGWPRTVCIHEQRLFFGGNASQPQTIWGSVVNDYTNFRVDSLDDMGISLTMAGLKANAVQWMVSQDTLLTGTAGEEGPIGSRDSDKPITPSSAKRGRFTTTGSAFLDAVAAQDTVLFVNRPRHKVWEMAFAFESDGYKANDLTLLAEHVADGGILGIAMQRNPETILWCVTGNGQLIGLVYEREQQVAGWFRCVTDGTFESVAVVGGSGEEDQVWVTVNRAAGRFVERFQPERMRLLKDGDQTRICSADCAVIYDGAAATVITGLDHLNGEAVSVLADGMVIEGLTVTGGQITLEVAASVVIVGLPFTATLEPTWLETNDPNSVSKAATKRITGIDVEFWKSLGCEFSVDQGAKFWPVQFRKPADLMDQAVPLFTGIIGVGAGTSGYSQRRSLILRQRQPLPMNIASLHIKMDVNIAP